MANAGCINAIGYNGCFLQTLQNLDSACIGVGVQFCAPDPLDDKRLDYIKYTDKCGCTCCLTNENEILIYATQGLVKNLTLTNNELNEVVNVKRTELFGSNRTKTIVRYKTGSAPVSITDGTLAVEETTMNQYSSTGYNVSGLADSTLYYFTAFAVDSNNNVIDSKSASITTDFFSPTRNLANATRGSRFDYGAQGVMSIFVSNNGKYLYVCDEKINVVKQYSLSTDYDVSTATYVAQVSTAGTPHQCRLSNDGTKLFVACRNGKCIDQFTMSTPYMLSTASLTRMNYGTEIGAIFFSSDGMLMFLAHGSSRIRKYQLSSPFAVDISLSYTQTSRSGDIRGACISNDGKHFFVFTNGTNGVLCQYDLSTAFAMPQPNDAHQTKSVPLSGTAIELVGNLTQDQKYLYITDEYRYVYRLNMEG